MSEKPHNARRWKVSGEEYHAAHDVYGRSMLDAHDENSILFHGRFVTHTIPLRKPSKPMEFGSNFDRMFLERENVIEIPAEVLKKVGGKVSPEGAKGSNDWKAFEQENAGKLLLKQKEIDIFRRMEDRIRSHPDASQLIQGQEQVAIRWEDPETGLPLKVRLDVLGDGRVVDLKTSKDPTPRAFANDIEKHGYHRQGGMYAPATELLLARPHDFFFVVIRNVEPYDVWCYTLGEDKKTGRKWIDIGAEQIRDRINSLAFALKDNHWEPAGYGGTHKLDRPKWAGYEDDYYIGETNE